MKNEFLSFFKLIVAFVACVGGIGYALYEGVYVIAVAIALLTILAWPALMAVWKDIKS
jgi:hypothetical protein